MCKDARPDSGGIRTWSGEEEEEASSTPHQPLSSASGDGAAGVQVLDLLLLCNSGA